MILAKIETEIHSHGDLCTPCTSSSPWCVCGLLQKKFMDGVSNEMSAFLHYWAVVAFQFYMMGPFFFYSAASTARTLLGTACWIVSNCYRTLGTSWKLCCHACILFWETRTTYEETSQASKRGKQPQSC